MVQFGTVSSFGISSEFMLRSGAPTVLLYVGSHAARGWHLAFRPTDDGPWTRVVTDPGAGTSYVFSGVGPAWGVLPYPPAGRLRVEVTPASLLAVTSVTLLETPRG